MSEVKFIKYKHGFTDENLDLKESIVLSYLASMTKKEYCFASNEKISEACNINDRTVYRVLNSLEEKDLIQRVTKSTGFYGKDRRIYVNPTVKSAYHSK